MEALSVPIRGKTGVLAIACCTVDAKLLMSNNALLIYASGTEFCAQLLDHPSINQRSAQKIYFDAVTTRKVLDCNNVVDDFVDPVDGKTYWAAVAPVTIRSPYNNIEKLFVAIRADTPH
jgi:hypothetical protein